MFDPVTDEALRLRRSGRVTTSHPIDHPARTLLVCGVCGREMQPEEDVHWVSGEVHCVQCHSMLEYEYERERKVDAELRSRGTKWEKGSEG